MLPTYLEFQSQLDDLWIHYSLLRINTFQSSDPKTLLMLSRIFFLIFILPTNCFGNQQGQSCFQDYFSQQANDLDEKKRTSTTHYHYKVIAQYPHDSTAFTQGLIFYHGYLYESTGLLGKSSVRKINISNGQVLLTNQPSDIYFGEGLTIIENTLIQMSWKTGKVFFFQPETLKLLNKTVIEKETWGITTIENQLIISDGSSTLSFFTADNFKIFKTLEVDLHNKMLQGLNELEYANGFIYANVWPTSCIVIINPENGKVDGWLNLSGLNPEPLPPSHNAVLNGIAYQANKKHFFITGKFWPSLYEIELLKDENLLPDN